MTHYLKKTYSLLEDRFPSQLKSLIPESWRIWVGYQLKVRLGRRPSKLNDLHHPLSLPAGESEQSLLDCLKTYHDGDARFNRERDHYLAEAFHRFLYTLALVPEGTGRLLEIGASPYYFSLLLMRFRQFELAYCNYLGDAFGKHATQTLYKADGSGQLDFAFDNVNIEVEQLPYADQTFEVALICEVLEHFTNDPQFALLELHRLLKPNGTLILTTPNVVRLANVARTLAGHNLYDPFSAYGPYGRHNREYTVDELAKLITASGFTIDTIFTSDVHINAASRYMDPEQFMPLLSRDDLGQYIFVKARKSAPPTAKKPDWLYRSYPDDELAAQE